MKIISWNVNGIRSVGSKGFFEWIEKESPDIICVQETKANANQLEPSYTAPFGYQSFWHSAKKPGYSGVAIFAKVSTAPKDVIEGLGVSSIDDEGRVLTAEFGDFTLVNAYFPNSQREHGRLGYKLEFCDVMFKYCQKLRKEGRSVILCGDYNIAHKEVDLKNPKPNVNNAGFLPAERAWMDKFVDAGWVDSFRHFNKEPGNYSWWSYRPGVREKNIGWRIDYHCVNSEFASSLKSATIRCDIFGSDHCPVAIELG